MFNKLAESDEGKIFLLNMYFAYKNDFFEKVIFESFFQECKIKYNEIKAITSKAVINIFLNTIKNQNLYLKSKKTIENIEKISRVMRVFDFIHSQYGLLRASGISSNTTRYSQQMLDTIQKQSGQAKYIKKGSLIKGKEPLAWVTHTELIKDKNAEEARNLLGLCHYDDGIDLVCLHYPNNIMVKYKCASPTFFDAGGHTRFRAINDRGSVNSDGWGRTVDLLKLKNKEKLIEGLPEAVIEPVPIDEDFSWNVMGATKSKSPNSKDSEFLKYLVDESEDFNSIISKAIDEFEQLLMKGGVS